MLAALFRHEEPFPIAAVVTIIYLASIVPVLVLGKAGTSRPMEGRLIGLGLLTGVFAVWCSFLVTEPGASVQVRGGQAGVVLGGDGSGLLGRIAVVLVLAGVAISVLRSWTGPTVASNREEASRAYPQ